MSKRPSPIRVTSPASANHIVRLHPQQDAVVTFDSKESNNIVMKSDSDFITTITDSSTYFKFGQKFDFSDFTKNSKLYLGNISFDKGDSTPIVNLSVILESQEEDKDNKNYLTILLSIIFIFSILLTGERSNTIRAALGISIFFMFYKNLDIKKK